MSTGSPQLGYLPFNFPHLFLFTQSATSANTQHATNSLSYCSTLPELTYLVVYPTIPRINFIKIDLETNPEVEEKKKKKKKNIYIYIYIYIFKRRTSRNLTWDFQLGKLKPLPFAICFQACIENLSFIFPHQYCYLL